MEPISAPNLMSLLPPMSQDQNLERRDADLTELISFSILTWSGGRDRQKPFLEPFSQELRVLHFIGGGATKPIVFREQTKTSDILKRKSLPQYLKI